MRKTKGRSLLTKTKIQCFHASVGFFQDKMKNNNQMKTNDLFWNDFIEIYQ